MPNPAANCYDHMAAYIDWKTTPTDSRSAGPTRAIIRQQLHKSIMFVEAIHDPTTVTNFFSQSDYLLWEANLKSIYSWHLRYRRDTSDLVDVHTLLAEAHKHWAENRFYTTPSAEERSCSQQMANFINLRATPKVSGAKLLAIDIWRSSRLAGLLGLTDTRYPYRSEDYMAWADHLSKEASWTDKRPHWLWGALSSARENWVRINHNPNTKPKPKPTETEKTGVITMERQFATAFAAVDIEDEGNELQDESTNAFRRCDFCGKETIVHPRNAQVVKRLSPKGFFCTFCIRHNFHTKRRQHIMILSFRALIGYLFYFCYFGRKPRLYLSQVEDLIDMHIRVGELNPVFYYDQDTFCWFVDFLRVGKSKRKVPVEEVLRTVNEIISAFNPYDNIADFKGNIYAGRFAEAITDFYTKRYRPEGKPICIPSLTGCACDMRESATGKNQVTTKKVDISTFRNFLPTDCKFHTRR